MIDQKNITRWQNSVYKQNSTPKPAKGLTTTIAAWHEMQP